MNKGNKVFIGFQLCYIKDYVNILQCFKCQQFGHKYKHCKKSTIICLYCGENHSPKDCSNKMKKSFKCVNCDGSHAANHKECPSYIENFNKMIGSIDYLN